MQQYSFCFCKLDYDQQRFTSTLLHEAKSLTEHQWLLGCQDFVDFTNDYQAYKTHVKDITCPNWTLHRSMRKFALKK